MTVAELIAELHKHDFSAPVRFVHVTSEDREIVDFEITRVEVSHGEAEAPVYLQGSYL